MNTPLLPRQAWIVVAMLVAASVISYLDLQVLAVLVAPIKADLGIDDGRIGLLYGVFAVFYAFAGVPVARLSDRYSRKRLITAGMCLWSVMTLLAGLSRTFEHLLLARIGMGIGMAVLTPAATSLIADCFARERTALAVSIFQTGSVVGSGLAFVIGGVLYRLAEHHGPVSVLGLQRLEPWQQVMLLSGLPGLLLAPFMLGLREPPRSFHASARTPMASWVDVGRFYRRNAQTLALHHGGFLALALVGFGFVFWSVTFLIRTHGMAPAAAAQRFGWIYLIAGTLGSLWAPLLAARFARSGRRDANIFAAMLGGAGTVIAIVATQLAPNAFWALVCYVPALFFITSPFALAYGSLPVITPAPMRAVVTSIFMFTVNLGILLGPPLTGLLNERVFEGHDGVRSSLLVLTIVCGGVGLALLALARKPYARSLAEADAGSPAADIDTAMRSR